MPTTQNRSDLIQSLADQFMAHPEISRISDEGARELSGTKDWSPDQFEQMESSHQYQLYYAEKQRIQAELCSSMLTYLLSNG